MNNKDTIMTINFLEMTKYILFAPLALLILILGIYAIYLAIAKKKPKVNIMMFTGIGVSLLVVFFVSFVLPEILIKEYGFDFNKYGVYGDLFGCFNSLMSALAFGGLIYTIILQRKDLELQRDELKLTREELKRQAEAQEKSVTEQANQAKLIEDQINKDIRPYINAYWEWRNRNIYFVIKNVGRCAASDFEMHVSSNNNQELLEPFLTNANGYRLNVVPSQLEYVIPLSNPYSNDVLNDWKKWQKMKTEQTIISVRFEFKFRDIQESFSIDYEIKYHHLAENKEDEFKEKVIKVLNKIGMGNCI